MTLKGVMALILRYSTEFGSFRAHCVKVIEDVVVKKFAFAISSPDEFLVFIIQSVTIRKNNGDKIQPCLISVILYRTNRPTYPPPQQQSGMCIETLNDV